MTFSTTNQEQYGTQAEGKTTRAIESRTSKAPSLVYLGTAIGAMAASAALMIFERSRMSNRWNAGAPSLANFVGQWAPTILIMGLYNKVVKLERQVTGLR